MGEHKNETVTPVYMAIKTSQLCEYTKQISLRTLSVPTSPNEKKCLPFPSTLR